MPTGYTAQLQSMDYDTKKWLKESLSRAFGICIMLRDEGNLSQAEIEEKLKAKEESYYTKALREAREKLTYLTTADKNDIERELEELKQKSIESRQKRIKEFYYNKSKHEEVLSELKRMREVATDEVSTNIINYGIEQLEQAIPFDFKECCAETPDSIESMTVEEYIQITIFQLEKDIERYIKNIKEEDNRDKERYESYKTFVEFVDNYNKE